jgi:cell division protein FtsL
VAHPAAHTEIPVTLRVSPAPSYDEEHWEEPRPPRKAPARARPARSARRVRARLPAVLFVFLACLALLAVARISLSFAVVQKNLATTRIVNEQRALTVENSRLSEEAAALSSTLRVRTLALDELHLVPSGTVIYLKAPAKAKRPALGR